MKVAVTPVLSFNVLTQDPFTLTILSTICPEPRGKLINNLSFTGLGKTVNV